MSKHEVVTVRVLSAQGWQCWGPQRLKGVCGMEAETNGVEAGRGGCQSGKRTALDQNDSCHEPHSPPCSEHLLSVRVPSQKAGEWVGEMNSLTPASVSQSASPPPPREGTPLPPLSSVRQSPAPRPGHIPGVLRAGSGVRGQLTPHSCPPDGVPGRLFPFLAFQKKHGEKA